MEILLGRRFHPWEGGEGLVSGQYVWAHRLLGILCMNNRDFAAALEHFNTARVYPQNLGEGKHLLTEELDLDYFSGVAQRELGRDEMARNSFMSAAESEPTSPWMGYYKALALRSLGKPSAAGEAPAGYEGTFGGGTQRIEPSIDYFATSLPNFLVFEDDLTFRKEIECTFTDALVELGLGSELGRGAKVQQWLTGTRTTWLAHDHAGPDRPQRRQRHRIHRPGWQSRPIMNIVSVSRETPTGKCSGKQLYVWIVASIAALARSPLRLRLGRDRRR